MKVLEDIGLDNISFSPNGRNIKIDFVDMYEGEPLSTLTCKEIFLFNFNNFLEYDPDDYSGFAHYISDINVTIVKQKDIAGWMTKNCFNFFLRINGKDLRLYDDDDYMIKGGIVWLHMESGDTMIDIGSKTVLQDGKVILSTIHS